MRSNFVLFFTIALSLFSLSCNRVRIKDIASSNQSSLGGVPKDCSVTYNEHIAPIMQSSCIQCHSSGGEAGFKSFDSFASVAADRNRIVDRIRNKSMPPLGRAKAITGDEFKLLEKWVVNGAPENKQSCVAEQVNNPECEVRTPKTARNSRRLTKYEFKETLRYVFGNQAINGISLAIDRLPNDTDTREFFDTESKTPLSESLINVYEVIGESLGAYFVASETNLRELDPCLTVSSPSVINCIKPLVRRVGEKAFRRPLTDEEVSDYTNGYSSMQALPLAVTSKEDIIQTLVSGIIQSPFFVYHLEIDLAGETNTNNVYLLNQFEIASRLSYAIWGSAPDEPLLTAAKEGSLSSLEEIKSQSKRMLADSRSKSFATHFFRQYFGLNQLKGPNPSTSFLRGLNITGLTESAGKEVEAFINLLIDGNKPYKDFFLSRKTYIEPLLPGTEALKTIYGANSTGLIDLPIERPGILTKPAMLFNSDNHAKPIRRGVNIRKYILCDEPPPPPAGADNTPPIYDPNMNTNERAHALTSNASCIGCHARINPPGYLLISYDPIGRFQTQEGVYGVSGADNGNFIKNVSFKLNYTPVIESTSEAPVEGPIGFMNALSESDVPLRCFSKRRYGFLEGRSPSKNDSCVVNDLANNFKQGGVMDLLSGFITPELLLRRVEE